MLIADVGGYTSLVVSVLDGGREVDLQGIVLLAVELMIAV